MKLSSILSVTTALQIYLNVRADRVCSNVRANGEGCMTVFQLIAATNQICTQERNNTVLWQQVIDCHKPISEEFMRKSNEAQCPIPKYVEDPTDTNYSIQDVFFNICGFVDGGFINQFTGGMCFLFGKINPYVRSHVSEVAAVKSIWGNDVPCNVGRCILKLGKFSFR